MCECCSYKYKVLLEGQLGAESRWTNLLLTLVPFEYMSFECIIQVRYFKVSLGRTLPGSSDGKESTCNVGDMGSIPGLGRSPEAGMATHSSILACRIPTDRGAWQATVHGIRVRHDWVTKHILGQRNKLWGWGWESEESCTGQGSLFFLLPVTAKFIRSSFPNQGLNPGPQQWKFKVLTAGPPGNSQLLFIFVHDQWKLGAHVPPTHVYC